MTILILNWRDISHPLAGGAEIVTHEHAKKWQAWGHAVIQFSSRYYGSKKNDEIDKIKIIRYGNNYTVHVMAFLYYLIFLRGKIDLIVDEFHGIPFFTPLYAKCKKLAFIHETTEEIWFKNMRFPFSYIGFFVEPFLFKIYRGIPFMTVSNSTKKDLVKFGIKSKNIYKIYNGITKIKNEFKKEKEYTIIYVGRLTQDKGTRDAIYAFHEVKKRIKAQLWIVGREEKKDFRKELEKIVNTLNLEKYVTFFNYVSEEKKFELLKRAWVMIQPSIKEGWSLTVIEAASQGTPTVGYKTGGLQDSVIDGKTGYLVPINRYKDIAEKILYLFNNKNHYNNMSKHAEEWSEKFSWDKSVTESLKLINAL